MGANRDGMVGGRRRGAHPLGPFCLLASLLALILSAGYALAPALSDPPAYLALPGSSGATPARASERDAGAPARCAGPGCAGTATVAPAAPSSGAGSGAAAPTSGPVPTTVTVAAPAAPATSVGGARSTPGPPAPTAPAGVRVTIALAGGPMLLSAPASLADSPLLAELVGGYLRCWEGRARAYADSDTEMLREFLAEPSRSEAAGRIVRLRAEGRVQRFEGGHAIAVLGIEGDRAWLVDEYTVRVVAAPTSGVVPSATSGAGATPGPARTATPMPEVSERVRASFVLERENGGWKIAHSVSTPVR